MYNNHTSNMRWEIKPTTSKNITELTTYSKGNTSLIYATYYRSGTIYVSGDTLPVFEYNEEEQGTKFGDCDSDLDNAYCSEIVEFSKGMHKKTKERLEDYGTEELEEDGWECEESVIWIYGTLQIVEC